MIMKASFLSNYFYACGRLVETSFVVVVLYQIIASVFFRPSGRLCFPKMAFTTLPPQDVESKTPLLEAGLPCDQQNVAEVPPCGFQSRVRGGHAVPPPSLRTHPEGSSPYIRGPIAPGRHAGEAAMSTPGWTVPAECSCPPFPQKHQEESILIFHRLQICVILLTKMYL